VAGLGVAWQGMEGERGPEYITPALIENGAKREKLTIRGTAWRSAARWGKAWHGPVRRGMARKAPGVERRRGSSVSRGGVFGFVGGAYMRPPRRMATVGWFRYP